MTCIKYFIAQFRLNMFRFKRNFRLQLQDVNSSKCLILEI